MSSDVQLVWATQNAEPLIVEMARVSAPKNAKNMETGPRLLKYLIKHKHWSPFEMANMALEIHTTRAISCLLYTSPSPRDRTRSRMPSSA